MRARRSRSPCAPSAAARLARSDCTLWRRTPMRPSTAMEPNFGVTSPAIARSSVVLPVPLRPTMPVRSAPKLRSRFRRRSRPSGVASERAFNWMLGMNGVHVTDQGEAIGQLDIDWAPSCCVADAADIGALAQVSAAGETPGGVELLGFSHRVDFEQRQTRSTHPLAIALAPGWLQEQDPPGHLPADAVLVAGERADPAPSLCERAP